MFDVQRRTLPSPVSPVFAADYRLPADLEAKVPPEARGLQRDEVRLLVSSAIRPSGLLHRFVDLPDLLQPGDLLVVNDSATLPAAVDATTESGRAVTVHLSALDGRRAVVEPRRYGGRAGERLHVGDVELLLRQPLSTRLWTAEASVDLRFFLQQAGRPVRYDYVQQAWPLSMYQTVFARRPGSAEMPSAGRPFSPRVLAGLRARGVQWTTITLHTGLSSPEWHEPPQAEWFEVRAATVRRIQQATGRIIAVGTTVVRALEAAANGGVLRPARGWTDLLVGPWHGRVVADGLLTGLHEPQATHLAMLQAFAPVDALRAAYQTALDEGLLWHEFGDVHLLWR